jgi:hypothetical protein
MADAADHGKPCATVELPMVHCPYRPTPHLRHDHPVQWLRSVGAFAVTRYGVPCVVSATNASRRIPDGARITVGAMAGTVTIDELPKG